MSLNPVQAWTFGYFPPMPWSRANHLKFPKGIRERVETILMMTHRVWVGDSKTGWQPILTHPECTLAKLPQEFIEELLQYVAGTDAVRSDNRNYTIQGGTTGTSLRFVKPKDIDGIIVELDVAMDLHKLGWANRKLGWGFRLITLCVLGAKFQLCVCKHTHSHDLLAFGLCVKKTVDYAAGGVLEWCPMWSVDPRPEVTSVFKFRLVLFPYGESFFVVDSPWGKGVIRWDSGVAQHDTCPGVVQDYQGNTMALSCFNVHQLFHANSLSISLVINDNLGSAVMSNVKAMYM